MPWRAVYQEISDMYSKVVSREYAIKKKKSGKYIEWLISSVGQHVPTDDGKATGSPESFRDGNVCA
jgi:hypothetical protein